MGGLSHIGLSLTIIFVISLVVLVAELLFVLWRRRIFHRQAPSFHHHGRDPADANSSQAFSDVSTTTYNCLPFSYSKELLYFYFCMNSSRISRIQPNSSAPSVNSGESRQDDELAADVIDVFKLHNMMYGPPRFLFTIKEEEEVDKDNHHRDENCKASVKLGEYLEEDEEEKKSATATLSAVLQVVEGEEEDEAVNGGESVPNDEYVIKIDEEEYRDEEDGSQTPAFSTPCESPLYFTPTASPINPVHSVIPSSVAIYCEEQELSGPPVYVSFTTN